MSTTSTPWPTQTFPDAENWEGVKLMATITDILLHGTIHRIKTTPVILIPPMDDLTATRIVKTYTNHHQDLLKKTENTPHLCPVCDNLLGYRFIITATHSTGHHITTKYPWYCQHCDSDIPEDQDVIRPLSGHEIMEKFGKLKIEL